MLSDRIAILGYGSLIWDLEILQPHISGPWAMAAGPAFPMEFSRISPKRKMGLVLCLDAVHGAPCVSHAIASRRKSVTAAALDLARRERAPLDRIGSVCLRGDRVVSRQADIGERVKAWCEKTGWHGAVWTDLDPNFADYRGHAFSVEAGLSYLQGLRGPSRAEAVLYISNAPVETDTPLRRALTAFAWWRDAQRAVGLLARD